MDYKPFPRSLPYSASPATITPRLIIHGGAGNITPANLPAAQYKQFHTALLTILASTHDFLLAGHDALDTVTFAVEQLENCPLFNSGKGAVFTRDGVNELETSVMVSRGKKKRGVGLMGLRHVKNPIKLAREMLIRGERDLEGGNGEHRGPMSSSSRDVTGDVTAAPAGGAQGHDQMFGEGAEKLAHKWDLDLVEPSYFFTQNRWDEHVAGLEREKDGKGSGIATWDAEAYVPQGTCGAVALDTDGVCAVATSTGGMTNKLTGRIGDTPTLGAGFWAEEWEETLRAEAEYDGKKGIAPVLILSETLKGLMADCLPSLTTYMPIPNSNAAASTTKPSKRIRSTAISGTGNGDSFLRTAAVRTASAIAKYRPSTTLAQGLHAVTGPGGELVQSAGPRWKKTGEGEGGMIGIECVLVVDGEGVVVGTDSEVIADYNCGGMFRAQVTKDGKAVCRVWREEDHDGAVDAYLELGEGREYDVADWRGEKTWSG